MAVIRPAIVYSAPIWHKPSLTSAHPQGLATKLATIQNQALRRVTEAYKATPMRSLEVEALVPPIHLYMDSITVRHREDTKDTPTRQKTKEACDKITRRLRQTPRRGAPRRRAYEPTPKELLDQWIKDKWEETAPLEASKERLIQPKT
jgi:hypothetical protein